MVGKTRAYPVIRIRSMGDTSHNRSKTNRAGVVGVSLTQSVYDPIKYVKLDGVHDATDRPTDRLTAGSTWLN